MPEKVEVGSVVEGKVVRIKPFGAIVSLPDNSQGLVHISHISSSYVQNIEDHLAIGDVVKVKVLSSDPTSNKISLSIKEAVAQSKKPESEHRVQNNFEHRQKASNEVGNSFEDKFKDWLKSSNERQAGLNKRNKRR